MRELFQKLSRYEPEYDLTARVMKRIEEHQVATAYRRLVVTTLPLGVATLGLIGYRWYTFLAARDYSSVASHIVARASHVSEALTFSYWWEVFRVVRESLPMVETTLLLVSGALVAVFFWRLLNLRSLSSPLLRGDPGQRTVYLR